MEIGVGTVVNIDVANNLVSIILSIVTLLGIFAGFIAWNIRLESKVQYLEKDYDKHKLDTAKKDEVMWEKMDSIQASLNSLLVIIGELKGKIQ